MTNEEAIKILSKVTLAYEIGKVTITQKEINEALDLAIDALESQNHGSTYGGVSWGGTYKHESEPCEKKAVLIKDVKDLVSKIYEPFSKDYKYFMQKVDELPTVTPKKNGKCNNCSFAMEIHDICDDCIAESRGDKG